MSEKLFNKDFILIVLGQIVSLFGNAILRFALPLYLLRTTGSAALFGIVSATSFLPMIVLSLFGGVLADRVNKRNIMVGLDILAAIVIIIFYIALGQMPLVPLLIITLMLLYGISGTYAPAVQASMPAILNEKNLLSGNAIINQVSTLSSLLGPVIGGILYSGFGIYPILIVSAAAFFGAAIMEMFLVVPYEKQKGGTSLMTMVKGDLKESFLFIKNERPIFFRVAIIISLFNLFFSASIIIGMPILVVDILDLSDLLFGIAEASMALGGLVGGLLTVVIGSRVKLEKTYLFLVICSVSTLIMALAVALGLSAITTYVIVITMSFLAMAFTTLFVIKMITLLQRETPSHLIGKVMAAITALSMCATPVGQLIYGFLFDWFKTNSWVAFLVAGVSSALIVILSRKTFKGLIVFQK